MAYYKIINGIRYDKELLEVADQQTKGRGEWRISLDEIQTIYGAASDGKKITETEWRTLRYIAQKYPLTAPALRWLEERFELPDEFSDFESLMQRIVRFEFGMTHLQWQITAEEASRQNRNPLTAVDFASALRQALQAFLERGMNQLSLGSVVGRRVAGEETEAQNQKNIRDFINSGATLFLVPLDVDRDTFGHDLPVFLNTEGFWYFGLHIPTFSPVLFMAQGTRSYRSEFYNKGYISRRAPLENVVFAVVKQLAQFTRLRWDINLEEVGRQLKLQEGQNFGEALFAALHVGIFNGESSFSFRDFILQEVWVDPERPLEFYQREYIESGILTLVPPGNDLPDFKIPENLLPDFDYNWVFGLKMLGKTDACFVITAQREGNLDASWNDGFLPRKLSFEQQHQLVLSDEFDFPNLQFIGSEQEFEAQRMQFGPDYRTFSSLLRQALNTILHDYLNPQSVFNTVAKAYEAIVSSENFDDPHTYRDAIKYLIKRHLRNGSLEFLPIALPDHNPVNGEKMEEFWLFFGRLPDLSPIGFWVIIPRHPDDGQLSYCYGFN